MLCSNKRAHAGAGIQIHIAAIYDCGAQAALTEQQIVLYWLRDSSTYKRRGSSWRMSSSTAICSSDVSIAGAREKITHLT